MAEKVNPKTGKSEGKCGEKKPVASPCSAPKKDKDKAAKPAKK